MASAVSFNALIRPSQQCIHEYDDYLMDKEKITMSNKKC